MEYKALLAFLLIFRVWCVFVEQIPGVLALALQSHRVNLLYYQAGQLLQQLASSKAAGRHCRPLLYFYSATHFIARVF